MLLIRYRTGDMLAFKVDSYRCGAVLNTLDTVGGRFGGVIEVGCPKDFFALENLDKALFSVSVVVDYSAFIDSDEDADLLTLRVTFKSRNGAVRWRGGSAGQYGHCQRSAGPPPTGI